MAEIHRNLWDRAANTWRRLVDTATVTWDTSTPGQASASVPDGGITLAKLQDIASSRVLGRATAGSGDVEQLTLSQVLDFIGSAAQGDILYRAASAWARLGAGTSGQFLQTQGAGANPQWASAGGLQLLNSGTVSNAATLDIVLTSFTAYRGFKILLSSFVPATDDVELWMRFSTNGGSSFDATGYGYSLKFALGNAAPVSSFNGAGAATFIPVAFHSTATLAVSNVASEGGVDAEITIQDQTAARFTRARVISSYHSASGTLVSQTGDGQRETAQDTDAVRFLFEGGGNIASGKWALYGYA